MSVQSNQIREPEVNEEVQPTGDGARSERQDWYFIPDENGNNDIYEGRESKYVGRATSMEFGSRIVREHNAHKALAEACRDALEDVTGPITASGIKIRYSTRDKLIAALSLVDAPKTKETQS